MKDVDKKPSNPFLVSPTAESKPTPAADKSQGLFDLFNDSTQNMQNISTKSANQNSGKASDDLLCLSNANPFADILNSAASNPAPTQPSFPAMAPNMVPLIQNQAYNGMPSVTTNGNNVFASEDGFAAAFGKSETTSSSGMLN